MDAKKTLPIVVLVAVAAVAWWLIEGRDKGPADLSASAPIHAGANSGGVAVSPASTGQLNGAPRHVSAPVRQIKKDDATSKSPTVSKGSTTSAVKTALPKRPTVTTRPTKVSPPPKSPVAATNGARAPPKAVVSNAVVKSHGRVVHTGRVDLSATIARIKAGVKHRHRNDGSVFRNREKRLPRQRSGYYREYVHPTKGVRGAGPQRIVVGQGGEWYYTGDHYGTFVPLNE